MSLAADWLLFPIVLGLLSLGCGLAVERAYGSRLPALLLPPLGLAAIVVVSQLATNWDATAGLATPAVLALAVAGFALSRARLRSTRADWGAVAAALGVFAVFAAPVVLSGSATFAGYNLNGEPSIHFIGIDRLMQHGRSLAGLPPSSYQLCLHAFFGNGYPSGAQTALGSARPLIGQNVAWVYQPFLAFMATLAALSLYALIRPLVKRPLHRAAVVLIASQPGLVYAFSLQGSLKEVATVWIVTLLVAVTIEFLRAAPRPRSVVPLAVASAASLGVINVAVLPWLGLVLLGCLVLALRARPQQWLAIGKQALAFAALTAVLAYPPLSVSSDLYNAANSQLTAQNNLTAASGLGNLLVPLKKVQVVGIWLNGDYRLPPTGSNHDVTYTLIVIAIVSALIGLGWAARRRALGPLMYFAVSAVAGAYVVHRGSPWADGKAMMITSPAVMLAAMLGPAALADGGARRRPLTVAAAALGAVIAIGVLWTNALAYHDVNLAPRDRLQALDKVGERIAGQGPAVYFEFEEYGKHFLRRADPEGRTEACEGRYMPQRGGQFPQYGFSSDPDLQTMRYLLYYRTIVLRRSPALSRPPSIYRLTYSNRYYEVWQRPLRPASRVVEHLPLQGVNSPSASPRCRDLRRLARRAESVGGRIAYVPRPVSTVWLPARSTLPPGWGTDPSEAHVVIPKGPGRIQDSIRLPAGGEYNLWLGGSVGRPLEVLVDGRRVGEVSYALDGRDQFEWVARLSLTRGRHQIELVRRGGDLHPGNGSLIQAIGPVELEPLEAQARTVHYLAPSQARRLCGRDLDWIEIVRS